MKCRSPGCRSTAERPPMEPREVVARRPANAATGMIARFETAGSINVDSDATSVSGISRSLSSRPPAAGRGRSVRRMVRRRHARRLSFRRPLHLRRAGRPYPQRPELRALGRHEAAPTLYRDAVFKTPSGTFVVRLRDDKSRGDGGSLVQTGLAADGCHVHSLHVSSQVLPDAVMMEASLRHLA